MSIKRVRIYFAHQHEKEEKWLNNMAAKGFALISISGGVFYEFEECEPGEYIYRLELLEQMVNVPESQKYIQFVEDTGAELIGSWIRWVYFRKKAKEGAFDLFSDLTSKLEHFQRIRNLIMPVMFLEISLAIMNFSIFIINYNKYNSSLAIMLNKSNLYFSILTGTLGIGFALMYISLSKRIRSLQREKMIRE